MMKGVAQCHEDAVVANVVWIDPLGQKPGWWPRRDPGSSWLVLVQIEAGGWGIDDTSATKEVSP